MSRSHETVSKLAINIDKSFLILTEEIEDKHKIRDKEAADLGPLMAMHRLEFMKITQRLSITAHELKQEWTKQKEKNLRLLRSNNFQEIRINLSNINEKKKELCQELNIIDNMLEFFQKEM